MPSSLQVTKRLLALIEEDDSSVEQINQAARTLLQSTKGTSAGNLRNVLETLSMGLDVDDLMRECAADRLRLVGGVWSGFESAARTSDPTKILRLALIGRLNT